MEHLLLLKQSCNDKNKAEQITTSRIMSLVDVEYNDTKQTAKDELSKMMQFNNSQAGLGLFAPFIRKRNEFSHENEVRVFAAKDGPINTNSKWETLEINIAPVSEFIEGVMVHPFGHGLVCQHSSFLLRPFPYIMFDGRSELYQLKIEPYETILANCIDTPNTKPW